jgi:hypothetical protein
MSWSYRITILYLGFVGIIITLVTISSRHKEELVSKDYYARELKYQEHIDALANESALTESFTHKIIPAGILIIAPKSFTTLSKGSIVLFCPSDSKKDKSFHLRLNSDGEQLIPKESISAGIYKMQIAWSDKSGSKNYFKESVINIK